MWYHYTLQNDDIDNDDIRPQFEKMKEYMNHTVLVQCKIAIKILISHKKVGILSLHFHTTTLVFSK